MGDRQGGAEAGLPQGTVTDRRRLEDIQRQAEGARQRVVLLVQQADELMRERQENVEEQKRIEKDLAQTRAKLSELRESINRHEKDIHQAREQFTAHLFMFSRRMQALHEMRSVPLMGYAFTARDLGGFLRRMDTVRRLTTVDLRQLERLEALAAQIESKKHVLAREKTKLEELTARRAGKNQELLGAIQRGAQVLDRLRSEKAAATERAEKLERSSEEVSEKIRKAEALRRAMARARKASADEAAHAAPPADSALARELRQGMLGWPIDGDMEVVRPFGPIRRPGEPEFFNPGIDVRIAGPTTVKALEAGRVIHRGRLPSLGNVLMVDHGGISERLISVYGNLDSIMVAVGQIVSRGDPVALVGRKDGAAGPESRLHVEIRKGATPQDPLVWLER